MPTMPLVTIPDPDPLVVRIQGESVFLVRGASHKVWVIAYGGDGVQVQAHAVQSLPNRTVVIRGKPIANLAPPADFGFEFTGLTRHAQYHLVVDAKDNVGRTARDIAKFFVVNNNVEAFNSEIDYINNRETTCSVLAYGTSTHTPVEIINTANEPTKIVSSVDGTTIAGTSDGSASWWDWSVHYAVPQTFPQGDATVYVGTSAMTPAGLAKDSDSQAITIGDCPPPGPGGGGPGGGPGGF